MYIFPKWKPGHNRRDGNTGVLKILYKSMYTSRCISESTMSESALCQQLLDEVVEIQNALEIEKSCNSAILEELNKRLENAKRAHLAQVRHIEWYHYMH